MRYLLGILTAALSSLSIAAFAGTPGEDATSSALEVEALAARKYLTGSSPAGLSQQPGGALRVVFTPSPTSAFAVTAGALETRAVVRGKAFSTASLTREAEIGLRTRFDRGRFYAFAGSGISFLQSESAASYALGNYHHREAGGGVYYSLGVRAPLTSRITVGAELQQTIDVFSFSKDPVGAGGFHAGVSLGVRFGARHP